MSYPYAPPGVGFAPMSFAPPSFGPPSSIGLPPPLTPAAAPPAAPGKPMNPFVSQGMAAYDRCDWPGALLMFTLGISMAPSDGSLLLLRATVHLEMTKLDLALADLQSFHALGSTDETRSVVVHATYLQARVLLAQGKAFEAKERLSPLLADNATALVPQAQLLEFIDRIKQVAAQCDALMATRRAAMDDQAARTQVTHFFLQYRHNEMAAFFHLRDHYAHTGQLPCCACHQLFAMDPVRMGTASAPKCDTCVANEAGGVGGSSSSSSSATTMETNGTTAPGGASTNGSTGESSFTSSSVASPQPPTYQPAPSAHLQHSQSTPLQLRTYQQFQTNPPQQQPPQQQLPQYAPSQYGQLPYAQPHHLLPQQQQQQPYPPQSQSSSSFNPPAPAPGFAPYPTPVVPKVAAPIARPSVQPPSASASAAVSVSLSSAPAPTTSSDAHTFFDYDEGVEFDQGESFDQQVDGEEFEPMPGAIVFEQGEFDQPTPGVRAVHIPSSASASAASNGFRPAPVNAPVPAYAQPPQQQESFDEFDQADESAQEFDQSVQEFEQSHAYDEFEQQISASAGVEDEDDTTPIEGGARGASPVRAPASAPASAPAPAASASATFSSFASSVGTPSFAQLFSNAKPVVVSAAASKPVVPVKRYVPPSPSFFRGTWEVVKGRIDMGYINHTSPESPFLKKRVQAKRENTMCSLAHLTQGCPVDFKFGEDLKGQEVAKFVRLAVLLTPELVASVPTTPADFPEGEIRGRFTEWQEAGWAAIYFKDAEGEVQSIMLHINGLGAGLSQSSLAKGSTVIFQYFPRRGPYAQHVRLESVVMAERAEREKAVAAAAAAAEAAASAAAVSAANARAAAAANAATAASASSSSAPTNESRSLPAPIFAFDDVPETAYDDADAGEYIGLFQAWHKWHYGLLVYRVQGDHEATVIKFHEQGMDFRAQKEDFTVGCSVDFRFWPDRGPYAQRVYVRPGKTVAPMSKPSTSAIDAHQQDEQDALLAQQLAGLDVSDVRASAAVVAPPKRREVDESSLPAADKNLLGMFIGWHKEDHGQIEYRADGSRRRILFHRHRLAEPGPGIAPVQPQPGSAVRFHIYRNRDDKMFAQEVRVVNEPLPAGIFKRRQ